jgi:hypothetical protein
MHTHAVATLPITRLRSTRRRSAETDAKILPFVFAIWMVGQIPRHRQVRYDNRGNRYKTGTEHRK